MAFLSTHFLIILLHNNPIAIYLYRSKSNWISENVFSDNGMNIKEVGPPRYYCIFAFCFWVIWTSIMFPTFIIANIPTSYAEVIGGISFLGLLIGFIVYSKLILEPRLKKKMQPR